MNEQTTALIENQLDSYRLLEPIKISDTVHSWLNMLNRIVDICSIVGHPEEDKTLRRYSNVFGFMTSEDKLYLDGVKWGLYPKIKDEDDNPIQAVDIEARKFNILHSSSKTAKVFTSDASISTSSGRIPVNQDSVDVQCINARSDVLMELTANPDSNWYSEKLISIKALEEVRIQYSGNDFSFVNNSIYPNVEWSENGVPQSTLLLKGTFIVYRATFIHSRILLEIVENTQIIDNYKAASAKHDNLSFNGDIAFDADAKVLDTLTKMANGEAESKTFYLHHDGVVSSVADMQRCAATFEMNYVMGENAQWDSVTLRCRPVDSNAFLESDSMELQNGRHLVQMWTKDRTMVVKVDYAVNMMARTISILGFSVIAMNSGRTYDE